jgi:hypothetical protein
MTEAEEEERYLCVLVAITAVARLLGLDDKPMLEEYAETADEMSLLERHGVRLGIVCGYEGELPTFDPDTIDRPCVVVVVERDGERIRGHVLGIATEENLLTYSVRLPG